MNIRNERNMDQTAIAAVQLAAFTGHPQHAPGVEPTEHRIVERLRADGALALSLVAEDDGVVIGHIALSPADGGGPTGWYLLGPVGVLPERQRTGIGSALVREALERMRGMGAAGVVLVGDPAYYVHFGFGPALPLTYPGVLDRYVMALPFAKPIPVGEIKAHPAFHPAE